MSHEIKAKVVLRPVKKKEPVMKKWLLRFMTLFFIVWMFFLTIAVMGV